MDQDDILEPGAPYQPIWARTGNTLIERWDESFSSGKNHGIVTMVRFKNKKGKLIEAIGFVKWVHLEDPPMYGPISNELNHHGT